MNYYDHAKHKALADHELNKVCDTPEVTVFTLRRPGTGVYRVQLAFTPEGIHITGDVSLGRDQSGIGTILHKPLGWFAGDLSPDYLCSKFMPEVFQQEHAAEGARNNAAAWADEVCDTWSDVSDRDRNIRLAGEWLALARALDQADSDAEAKGLVLHAYYNDLEDDPDGFEGLGMAYPTDDAQWLVAIQARFRETWEPA